MMNLRCELVRNQLSAYHDEELPVSDRIAIAVHLENCASCAVEGQCSGELATCQANAECIDLANCLSGCANGDQGCIDDCASYYSGGVENYIRLLENWTGKRLTYYGSIINLYKSEQAKAAWTRQEMGKVPGETEWIPLPESKPR